MAYSDIKPRLTCHPASKPTMSVRESVPFLKEEKVRSVIDVGAGNGRNSLYLGERGFEVTAQDVKEARDMHESKMKKAIEQGKIKAYTDSTVSDAKYDAVLCNFVVNVIPDREEREHVVYRINDLLKEDGLLVFDARADEYQISHGKKYKDGHMMKRGKACFTFQKSYEFEEVEALLSEHGFEIEKVFRKTSSISLLARKSKSDRKFGQMYSPGQISEKADYVQFPISGLKPEEAIENVKKAGIKVPLMLHGDWEKNTSPDTILDKERQEEYVQIINSLKADGYRIVGLTLHPPKRKGNRLTDLVEAVNFIHEKTEDTLILLENRSIPKCMVSTPEEIKLMTGYVPVTLDVQGLYIALGRDNEKTVSALKELRQCQNIRELHVGDVKGSRVCVKLGEGELFESIKDVLPPARYITMEVLGGKKPFDDAVEKLQTP